MFNLNPKCVQLSELYGATDPTTFEWTDGLIAMATRKFTHQHNAKREKLVVCKKCFNFNG